MKHIMTRCTQFLTTLLLTAVCSYSAVAQVVISAPTFTAAQAGRTHMDIGGVWNGSVVTAVQGGALTSGDSISFTFTNGALPVFEFKPILSYPANFTPIGTPVISGLSGCAPITGLTYGSGFGNGSAMDLVATPSNNGALGGFDLPAGCTFTLSMQGMMAASTTPGTVTLGANSQSAPTDGGAAATGAAQTLAVPVRNGLSTITKSPNNQTRAVGQTASWPSGLTVLNTGQGGLFNVTLNESAISGMSLTSLSAAGATCAGSLCTLPYLAPSAQMIGSAAATVTSCQNITNTVSTTDVTGTTAKNTSAQVTLDLLQPLLSFTAPTINVPYVGSQSVSIPLTNTSTGPARPFGSGTGIQLATNLNSLGVTVSNVSAGWTYSAGTFSYTAGGSGGTIPAGAAATLTFDAAATNACTFVPGTLIVTAKYSDDCGNPFSVPTKVGSTAMGTGAPSVDLNKGSSIPAGTSTYPRQVLGTAAAYTITANLANFANIQGANIIVTDVLPAGITGITVAPSVGSASCGGPCVAGATLTWTIPKAALGVGPNASPTLQINYTAPSNVCLAGTFLNNTANYSGFTSALPANSCPLTSTSTQTTLLTLTPGAGTSQFFNVINPGSGTFETGIADATPFNVATKPNEGDLIPTNAVYSFGSASAGQWAGSSFNDDFGGLPAGSAVLSSNTLVMRIDTGSGSFVTVPAATVAANTVCGSGTLAANTCSGSLTVNLGFLSGASYFATPTVAAGTGLTRRIQFDYSLVMNDAAIAAGNISRTVSQIGTLTIAGDTAGCTAAGNTVYKQGDSYSIARARPLVALTLPNVLDVCQPTNLPISISNSANNKSSYNLLTTLLAGSGTDWRFTNPQTPTYGGQYTSLPLTVSPNGGNSPTWAHTNPLTPLTSNAVINSEVFLRAGVANGASVLGLQARVDYDDNQTAGGARDFAGVNGVLATSNVPVVRKGNLVVTVSPQTIFATGNTVQWRVFLTNTGNGTAYNAQFSDTLPSRLIPDAAGTNALNPAAGCAPQANCNVSVAGQTVSFNLGNIPAGETRSVFVKVSINNTPPSCTSVNGAASDLSISWGCGVPFETAQTFTAARPSINFPAAQMTAGHDSTTTTCVLCGSSSARVVARNTGSANIFNLTVAESLFTATQGTDYIAGSSEYSTDGTTWLPAGNPTLSAGAYRWTSAQVPPLAQLWPQSQSTPSQPYQVFIRFSFSTTALTATAVNPQFQVQTTGTMACGDFIDTGSQPFTLSVQKPNLSVAKTGLNRTAVGGAVGTGSYVENVYGGTGDVVEWRVVAQNTGNALASNVRLLDVFPGTGAATMSVVSGPACAGVTYPFTMTNNTATANLCNIPFAAGTNTHTYYIQETLGNVNCNGAAPQGINTAKISYGCAAAAAGAESGVNGLAGMSDTANVIRQPDLSLFTGATAQQFFQETNGRIRVELNITNNGGTAQNLRFSPVLSIGGTQGSWVLDTSIAARLYGTAVLTGTCVAPPAGSNATPASYTCTCTGAACLGNAVTTAGTQTAPTFTLSGTMRNAGVAKLVFYVLPNNADTTFATTFPNLAGAETTALGLDPAALGNLQVATTLSYQSTCAVTLSNSNTASFTSGQPDLDVLLYNAANSALDSNRVVVNGTQETFHFRVRNVGGLGSVAANMSSQLQIGSGWASVSVDILSATGTGFGGLPSACTGGGGFWTCSPASSANLPQNAEYVIRVRATPSYFANVDLTMMLRSSTGALQNFSGAVVNNYSLDRAQYRVVGSAISKTVLSTSEAASTGSNVHIGEEVTWALSHRLWGVGTNPITGITVRDTYAKTSGANQHQALGFVSITDTGTSGITGSVLSNPTAVGTATPWQVNYSGGSITGGEGIVSANIVTRVLNQASAVHNATLQNFFGTTFTYGGQVFRSNSAFDGFTAVGGDFASANLHAEAQVTVKEPQVTMTKEVCNTSVTTCNIDTGAGFSASSSGDASHTFIYRVRLSNAAGAAPAFNLQMTDTLPNNKLIMVAGNADAIANIRNTYSNSGTLEGTFTAGAGGSVMFNGANNTISTATPMATMNQLDAGQYIIMAYKVTGNTPTIVGGDTVTNTADLTFNTLAGATGGQTAPTGATGTLTGERSYPLTAQAVVSFSRVYGRVYLDNNHNGSLEPSDSNYVGTAVNAAPTPYLCAQLIQGTLQATTLLTATGNFSFSSAPSGNYEVRIVQAIAGPACPASLATAWAPASFGYIPLENNTQSISFTVSAASGAPALNFGLFQGTKIIGKVFLDNTGALTANDRLFNAQDLGLSGVTVCANTSGAANCAAGATLLDSTITSGNGDYELWIPLTTSPTTVHVVNAGTERTSTGANVSGTVLPNATTTPVGGTSYTYTYATGADVIRFSAVFGTAFGTLNFGEINPSVFTTDNQATVPAGSVRYYPHSFTASTTGSVSFATSYIATPASPAWTEQIYLDTNCNGAIDTGELQLTTATSLIAGQTVCILVKENVPATAGVGTSNTVTVTATFTAANTALVPVQVITHTDTTTVTAANAGTLELIKSVRNVTTGGTFAPNNTGKAGDILEYRIGFKNNGATSLSNVKIQDATPPYTTFQSALVTTPLPSALLACSKNTPVNPLPAASTACATVQAATGTGTVTWFFTGSLEPLQQGEVLFRVQVTP